MQPSRILVIGGLDPCGGAGITADARVAQALGAHALTVATCVTVQNRHGLAKLHPLSGAILGEQLEAALEDGPLAAVKTGLMTREGIEVVARVLGGRGLPLVVDPVLGFTATGPELGALVPGYREWLVPLATLLTPNQGEVSALAPRDGAAGLVRRGCNGVLVTDGDGSAKSVQDVLYDLEGEQCFVHPRLMRGPVHGTGCALATALAVRLGSGSSLVEACRKGIEDLQGWLERTPASSDGLPVPLLIS